MALVEATAVPEARSQQRARRRKRQCVLLREHDPMHSHRVAGPVRTEQRPSPGPIFLALLISLVVHSGLLWLLWFPAPTGSPEAGPEVLWVRVLAPPAIEVAAEEPAPRAPVPAASLEPPPEAVAPANPAPTPPAAAPEPRSDPQSLPVAASPPRTVPDTEASSTLPEPAVEGAPPPRPERVTAALDELRIVHKQRPSYPRAARLRGAAGVTVLRVLVERSGRVGEVEIERSAGDEDLDRAARRAIRGWRFASVRPPRNASGLWVLIPVEFRLR